MNVATKKFRHISRRKPERYPENTIRNQKYTWYTFVPIVFLNQFECFFNAFLFFIMVTQFFKEYAVSPLISSAGPWVVVLGLSFVKEGVDDYKRYERDKVSNRQMFTKLTEKGFIKVPSSKIQVGDLIMLEKNERAPADIVLLKTSDVTGQVFIRTDQLDGETDWKLKLAASKTQFCPMEAFKDLSILAEAPNKDIYSFTGKLGIGDFNESELVNVMENKHSKPTVFDQISKYFNINFSGVSNEYVESVDSQTTEWVYLTTENVTDEETTLSTPEEDIIEDEEVEGVQHLEEENKVEVQNAEVQNAEVQNAEVQNAEVQNAEVQNAEVQNAEVQNAEEEKVFSEEIKSNESTEISNYEHIKESLNQENMVWMNTVIATCSVLGCVVYTGQDTRAVLNTSKPRGKVGIIDTEFNNYMKFLGCCCALSSIMFTFLRTNGFKGEARIDILFIRFLVLFSNVIPISLKVTIDYARSMIYSSRISNDPKIPGSIIRSSGLPEELGRISYFLTDKTGTLTKNEMEMKKIHLGTICYTKELNADINKNLIKVLTRKEEKKTKFNRTRKDLSNRIFDLVEALSVCHNVTPVISDNEMTYQASSPDEVAIIKWTEVVGMKLFKRTRTSIHILDPLNNEKIYEILHIFPFTSESKRMGIIVKSNDEITFYIKGADVVMKKIIKNNDWVEEEVDNMAREGLRTLVIGKKNLSEETYAKFETLYNKAKLSLSNRNEAIAEAIATIERELTVLGLTGVEDKLQDHVKVTLENLRNAGMKVWMLTGDKIETAISIAISSRIFSRNSNYLVISNANTLEDVKIKLELLRNSSYNTLVIDGKSIEIIIDNCMDLFIDVASELDAVVGCRYTPTQKAIVARELKNRTNKRVCAIGDGGNDVSMIIEANLGIGIVGKEGNQASLAADISVNKFCYVSDLFFWHGRNFYKSSAKIAHLVIHRGSIISVIQAIFCALILFTPVSLFPGVLLVAFMTIFTPLPIFSVVNSNDVSRDVSLKFPELYKELVDTKLLSFYNFFSWNLVSVYQGVVIMFIFFTINQELSIISTLVYSCLVINEQLMVLLTVSRRTPFVFGCCGLSLLLFFSSFFALSKESEILNYEGPWYKFLFKIICVNVAAILVSVIAKIWSWAVNPPTYSKLEVLV